MIFGMLEDFRRIGFPNSRKHETVSEYYSEINNYNEKME